MTAAAKVLLNTIAECCQLIHEYSDGLTLDEFLRRPQIQDAVLRRIEIIGEAVKNLPVTVKEAHADVPWRQIARMRDHLIHRYFSVDLDLTWQTIQTDVPELHRRVQAILSALP